MFHLKDCDYREYEPVDRWLLIWIWQLKDVLLHGRQGMQ